MNLNELKQELEKDLPINQTDIQWELANNPVLYGKWLRYLSEFKMQARRVENQKAKALRDRLDYYTGRGDDICIDQYDKTELRTVIPADDKVIRVSTELEIVTVMIDFCRGALDAIKSRGFALKSIVEYRQLEAGR